MIPYIIKIIIKIILIIARIFIVSPLKVDLKSLNFWQNSTISSKILYFGCEIFVKF